MSDSSAAAGAADIHSVAKWSFDDSRPERLRALLALRDHVIAPILAGIRSPRMGRKPATWTRVDRDYETLRINMQILFHDLGITTGAAVA